MIAIGVRFLAGRYHATPWGRHVNEGVPEWPLAPWRLLRAFVATWKTKCEASADLATAEKILRSLAEPPEFFLPPAGASHTRHFMPWFKKGPGDKTLIFDTFVALSPQSEIVIVWPEASLDSSQRAVLVDWLLHFGYLGRAESWCEMRLLEDAAIASLLPLVNCRPVGTRQPSSDEEIVRVLCPHPVEAFSAAETPKHEASIGRGEGKQTVRMPLYDPDWHLCGETLWLHDERRSDPPPGSRWVRYTRLAQSLDVVLVPVRRQTAAKTKPTVARFVLDSSVLPLVTETLPIAELARRALLYRHRTPSSVLSGKSADGTPLEGHRHAFYLPTDEDGDGRLDHLTVIAADGFGPSELRALDRLDELFSRERHKAGHLLRVMLLGLGQPADFPNTVCATSRSWRSATPFVAPRHLKKNGAKRDAPELLASPEAFLAMQLRAELIRWNQRQPGIPTFDPASIEVTALHDGRIPGPGAGHRSIEFKRSRQKRGDDGGCRPAGAFRLTLQCPISGPLALGYAAHFGLGLFVPVEP